MGKDFDDIMYNGKNSNLDYVKKLIAQFLKIDNLSFLLGAGCSSYIANEEEKGIPTMRKLYDDFVNTNKDFKIADKDMESLFDSNLEKVLEALGAISIINNIKVIDKEADNKIKKIQNFIREKIKKGTNTNEIVKIYKDFYIKTVSNGRKSPINIFTTNYDLYNENALDLLSFPYNNGFIGTYKRIFNPVSYKFAYVEDMNLTKGIWERVPNFYNLYKIHGSITWIKERINIYNDSDIVNDSNYIIREIDYNNITDEDIAMIYPTPLKDRTTLMIPYSDLFRAMEIALLKKNSVLMTIGYSFSDEHINRLILNALSIPTFKLIIFGKSKEIDRIKDINNNQIIVINSESKIHYFKNFVKFIMPEVNEDINVAINQLDEDETSKIEGENNEQ